MEGKLPYYMVYPMPFICDDDRLDRRDYEYMMSLYPDVAKQVLPYVEEECDRCDEPYSMIYDEYPDQLQLRLMSRRVYDKVKANERLIGENGEDPSGCVVEGQQFRPARHDWLRDLIDVMLYQEIYKRRSAKRRRHQKFY